MPAALDPRLTSAIDAASEHAASVDREARFPKETIAALGGSGLLGLTLPESVGGLGGGPAEFLQTTRAITSRCASSAMVYLMHVCAAQVVLAGTAGGDSETILAMADGTCLGTLAFSEKGSRSHFWAPVSQLSGPDGDGRMAAEKSFVTSAGHADAYVVSTRPSGTESPVESSLYLVPAGAGGIAVGPAWTGLGLRGNASAPMTFSTPVAEASPLGETGKGLDLMLGMVLPWFLLGSAAASVGIADAAANTAVGHATSSRLEHLDQTLADLPTVRARLGRARIDVDTIGGFLSDVARRMAERDPAAPLLAAKASASETAIRVTTEAMQACGGAGLSPTLPVERNFRDARASSVMAPTTDVLHELVGRAVSGMPLL
jgi:alkylation response protein AidB-like acyl-CoA dehydrogenase